MKIDELTACRLDNTVQYLIERFDNSKWLLRRIYYSIISQSSSTWDARTFYTKILNDIIHSTEFEELFDDLVKITISPKVNIHRDNKSIIHSAKIEVGYDFLKFLRWNNSVKSLYIVLNVSDQKPNDMVNLSIELESIIGHEITHLIQRLHRLKDEFYEPGELQKAVKKLGRKDSGLEWNNDTNYYSRLSRENLERDKEIVYYLKHGELIAHAYTIASKLIYSSDWQEDLSTLYRYGWSEKYHILKRIIQNPSVDYVIKYSEIIHQAERRGLIADGKGKKLWNKLFKEIYRSSKEKTKQ
jgi:hypothetical protein